MANQIPSFAWRALKNIKKQALKHDIARFYQIPLGRMNYLIKNRKRFVGSFGTHGEALAAASKHGLAGYDHESVVDISFEKMCKVAPWDYPILFWLQKLLPDNPCLIDAGGHMGTKFRAFGTLLDYQPELEWVVYDLPEMVAAGRDKAELEGVSQLSFIDTPSDLPASDLMLASGLLQYLDTPFSKFLSQLPKLPHHLLLNKVATREGPTIVTLENFGCAFVPYQIRNQEEFISSITDLGYKIIDQWENPSLSHTITTHPELKSSTNLGFYLQHESRLSD